MSRFPRLRQAGRVLSRTVALAAVLGGCAAEAAPPRIAGGATSLDELGRKVWGALVARDTAALERLRFTMAEHNRHVWPEQPGAHPEAGFPIDLAWQNIQVRNRAALAELLAEYGGSHAVFRAARCEDGRRTYETYHALMGCHLVVAGADGRERRVRPFHHAVVMDGRYRIVRYYGRD